VSSWSRARRNFGTTWQRCRLGGDRVAARSAAGYCTGTHRHKAPAPNAPQRHALLVAVSQYPSFPAGSPLHLNGPKNDVQLIRTLLQ